MPQMPMCPRLSRVNSPSPLDPKGTAALLPVPCRGTECALYIIDVDETGKPMNSGRCVEVVNAIAQMRLAMAVESIAENVGAGSDVDEPPAADA